MPEPGYFIAIFDDGLRPHVWRWEIVRGSSPMGVKLGGVGYRSRMAAEFAGSRALKDFLSALAAEQIRTTIEERHRETISGLKALRRAI